MMALIIVPTVLYLNRIMTKLQSVVTAVELVQRDYEHHLKDSEAQKDKLYALDRETALNSALLKRHNEDIAFMKAEAKRSPI